MSGKIKDKYPQFERDENGFITWGEVRKKLFTPEEIAVCDLKVALMGEILKAREEKGLTQRQLQELSGVPQPVIARMERMDTVPNLNTVLKVLVAMGKTLYIGDLDEEYLSTKSR